MQNVLYNKNIFKKLYIGKLLKLRAMNVNDLNARMFNTCCKNTEKK